MQSPNIKVYGVGIFSPLNDGWPLPANREMHGAVPIGTGVPYMYVHG